MNNFAGKKALIVGASGGMGSEIFPAELQASTSSQLCTHPCTYLKNNIKRIID